MLLICLGFASELFSSCLLSSFVLNLCSKQVLNSCNDSNVPSQRTGRIYAYISILLFWLMLMFWQKIYSVVAWFFVENLIGVACTGIRSCSLF